MSLAELEHMSAHFFVHLNVILGGRERILARQQRIHKYPERPPVDRMIVRLDAEYLRCHVLYGAANRARSLARWQPFRQAEIDELHVTALVQQDILHFNVTIDDAVAVQVVEHETHLDGVDGNKTLGKVMHLEPERQQLTVLDEIGDYVEESLRLPVEPRLHYQRVVYTRRGDGHLVFDLLQRSIAYHLTLPHDFHRVHLITRRIAAILVSDRIPVLVDRLLLFFHFYDMSERASTNHVENLEIGLGDLTLHAELGHKQRLVNVDRIVGVGVSVRVRQRLGLVLATRRVPKRVAHETCREERRRRAVVGTVTSILERIRRIITVCSFSVFVVVVFFKVLFTILIVLVMIVGVLIVVIVVVVASS